LLHLSAFAIFELPYSITKSDTITLAAVATKRLGTESGYLVYMSLDGSSYSMIARSTIFNPGGMLVHPYPDSTYTIDDDVGFEIQSEVDQWDVVTTVSRTKMFTYDNLALLGEELVSFQTINPHESFDNRYVFSNIVRGRLDTEKAYHDTGTNFFYIGRKRFVSMTNESFMPNTTRYFKIVPYNKRGALSQSGATTIAVKITGRAIKPLPVAYVKANGKGINPRYTSDITLEWWPRNRTSGAGLGPPDSCFDSAASWDGYFGISVKVGNRIVRKVTGLDSLSWVYTESMNVSDNGGLADELTFYVVNYREVYNNRFTSTPVSLTVKREGT